MLALPDNITARAYGVLLFAVLSVLVFSGANASEHADGVGAYFSDLVVGQGEVLDGGAVVYAGDATVESAGTVEGHLIVHAGDARVFGTVNGNVMVLTGDVFVGEEAVVRGAIDVREGNLDRRDGSVVQGAILLGNNRVRSKPSIGAPFPDLGPDLVALVGAIAMASAAVGTVWMYRKRKNSNVQKVAIPGRLHNRNYEGRLYCRHCGAEVQDNARYCAGCGEKVETI